eukprot:6605245-Prymnesium_polylepis.1
MPTVWESRILKLIAERLKQRVLLLEPECVNVEDPAQIAFVSYLIFDESGTGHFHYLDFKRIVRKKLMLRLPNRRLRRAWRDINADDSATVDFYEFANA